MRLDCASVLQWTLKTVEKKTIVDLWTLASLHLQVPCMITNYLMLNAFWYIFSHCVLILSHWGMLFYYVLWYYWIKNKQSFNAFYLRRKSQNEQFILFNTIHFLRAVGLLLSSFQLIHPAIIAFFKTSKTSGPAKKQQQFYTFTLNLCFLPILLH